MRAILGSLLLMAAVACAGFTDRDRVFLAEEITYELIANDQRSVAEDIVAVLDIAANPEVTGDVWNTALNLMIANNKDKISPRNERRLQFLVGKLSVAVEADLELPLNPELRRIAGVYAAAAQAVLDE